jgi:hypothetical protein
MRIILENPIIIFFFKMKVIIQQNFTSGLGDFISDLSHYLTTTDELRQNGYDIHLKISLNSNKYVMGKFFDRVFNTDTRNFFSSIEETPNVIREFEVDGCKYFGSNHDPQKPGVHHFDIFFDEIPENFKHPASLYLHATRIRNDGILPKKIPVFSDEVMDRVKFFWNKLPEEYDFLHIRTSDIIDRDTERYQSIVNKVENYLIENNTNLHLGTNNKFIYERLKNNPKIFVYEFEGFDSINNDMNAFTYGYNHSNITEEFLINRLMNIFSEMVSIIKVKKIFTITDFDWTSNFLFYPLSYSENKIQILNL